MNVLLINGSPHAHGCTDAALQEIAKALNADGIETALPALALSRWAAVWAAAAAPKPDTAYSAGRSF